MKLNAITTETVQSWIMGLSREGYNNSSINILLATLKLMMKEAVRIKLISVNPMDKIKKLIAHNKEVQILKIEEVQKLFPADWTKVWESYEVYTFNKLAACTGMRLSEIIGLQISNIHEDYILVCSQYSEKYGVRPLKTKDSRNIPITSGLREELLPLIKDKDQVYLFTENNGEPISRYRIYRETSAAFEKIGIGREERKERGLVLHHWRHFLNTALLMANVSTLKVQKVTGHKSLSMTKHYAHFDSREFSEVLDVQNNLLRTVN
jgi:integrase/recombinase XerD